MQENFLSLEGDKTLSEAVPAFTLPGSKSPATACTMTALGGPVSQGCWKDPGGEGGSVPVLGQFLPGSGQGMLFTHQPLCHPSVAGT